MANSLARRSNLTLGLFVLLASLIAIAGRADDPNPVAIVSAANLSTTVAPEAVVSAFGAQLAVEAVTAPDADADPDTPGRQLPTTLGGTQVRINDESAELLFVSPTQINLLIPKSTAPGVAAVTVISGGTVVARGTVQVSAVAPALFSANGTGQGVPVGYLQRAENGQMSSPESLTTFNPVTNSFLPKPIIFGSSPEELYLVLFASGIRGAAVADANGDGNYNEMIHVAIDGQELVPDYAGPQQTYAGLDQINLRLPRNLSGRGRINLSITATGCPTSNVATLEIGGEPQPAQPLMKSFAPAAVLAGDELTINGTGFSSVVGENTVEMIDGDAQAVVAPVLSAATGQLKVRVPFGVGAGKIKVTVRTSQGELAGVSQIALNVRTSISGFIQDSQRQAIPGVTVRLTNAGITAKTDAEGVFLLPDVPPATNAFLEIDTQTVPGGLPYTSLRCKMRVRANRDNLFPSPIELGTSSGLLAGSALSSGGETFNAAAMTQEKAGKTQSSGPTLELPDGTEVRFPDGTTGNLALAAFAAGRTPFDLPAGHFSSAIAQITPFRATITPGGKLTFPNSDNLPAGAEATLFRFDQTLAGPSLGSFVAAGKARVSDNGQSIETEANAITETSYHFVSIARPVGTLLGRVVDADGQPQRWVLVQARGQSTFTDGLGGFVLRNVPVLAANDQVTVEVSFLRATRRVERMQRAGAPVVAGGVTRLTEDIVLPAATGNRPPLIIAPESLFLNQGELREVNFLALDPDGGQPPVLGVADVDFATVVPASNDVYTLRLAPGPDRSGEFSLRLSATDEAGAQTVRLISLRVNRAPLALSQSVIIPQGMATVIRLAGQDPEGDALRFIVVNKPAHGSLSGLAPTLSYAPQSGYSGNDSFTFKVSDGYAESRAATVTITITPADNLAPALTSLNPGAAVSGGAGFTLTVNGTNFISSSVVRWNGGARNTNFISSQQLRATIPASDIGTAGTAVVTVINPAPGGGLSNALSFAINCPTITITPATILLGTRGTAYNQSFSQTGGTGIVTFSLTGALPAGMSFSGATLSGTPAQVGSFPITVRATDASGCVANRSYTLTINCPTITVSPAAVPPGTRGTAYNQSFSQTGGAGTVTFSLTGTLPAGMNFSGATLSGTPTQIGSFPITVRATDASGCLGTRSYTLTINCPTITVSPATISQGTRGTSFNQTFTQSGGAGTVTFSLTGALPTGMRFSGATLSGTPTQTGSFPIMVRATDASGCVGNNSYTLVINCQSITVNPATISPGTMDIAYNQTFTQTGAIGVVTFSLSGRLPAGMSFSGATLSGTPTQTGNFPITVKATDAGGCSGTRSYTLTISNAKP